MGKRKDIRLTRSLANSSGFGMVESIISVAIVTGIALVASIYLTSSRVQLNKSTNLGGVTNLAALIGQAIVNRSAGGALINDAEMCSQTAAVPWAGKTSVHDPFCCEFGANYCTGLRQGILCGTYEPLATIHYETQFMRTSATWARNFYSSCRTTRCGLTDTGGANICAGLLFNDTAEIDNFFSLLPDPQARPMDSAGQPVAIDEITLRIEPALIGSMDTGLGCGAEPNWTLNHIMKVTITIIIPGIGQGGRQTSSSHTMHLIWPRDAFVGASTTAFTPASPPSVQSWQLWDSGPGAAVTAASTWPGAHLDTIGSNADNVAFTPGTYAVYYQDGTVRAANTMCSGHKMNGGLGWQDPGPGMPAQNTYVGWDKFVYQATAMRPGLMPYCRAPAMESPAANAAALNICCDSIAGVTVVDESTAGQGTYYFLTFGTALAEGMTVPIGQIDSMGNKTISHNIMATPGYCPPTNSYCADGSRTGIEVGGQAEATYALAQSGVYSAAPSPRGCPATGTAPYMPTIGGATDIFCHPHDGCWGMCPNGTRTTQNCKTPTTSYCSIGYNMGSRGCGAATVNPQPGIDCQLDNRTACADNVCDDCGHDTCPDSTVPFAAKNAGLAVTAPFPLIAGPWGNYFPYGDAANFPGSYIGVPGDLIGGCPATNTYCPVGAWSPAAATNPPGTIYYLPKDNCGNSCPDGTRIYQTCPPDTTTYCSLAPVGAAYVFPWAAGEENQDAVRVSVPGWFVGARTPRCVGAQCSTSGGTPSNNTPRDDCNQYCVVSTYVPQSTGCPATATYCPDTTPWGAVPGPSPGCPNCTLTATNPPSAAGYPNWLPKDACGNDCPVGTLPAPDGTAHDGCPTEDTYCYDADGPAGVSCVGAVQPGDVVPGSPYTDVCGRQCQMRLCTCPDPATICQGITYYSDAGGPCAALPCSVTGTKAWNTQSDVNWCPVDGSLDTGVLDSGGHQWAVAWCDDVVGHHHTIDQDGTKPSTCPTEVPLWCVGDAVTDSCGDPCAGGGTKGSVPPICDAASNWCIGYNIPDRVCNDAHGNHNYPCGAGSKTWTLCGAVGSQPCGTARQDTCTDGWGSHSTDCTPNTYSGYNSGQCTTNQASTSCRYQAVDNCSNAGCGWGNTNVGGTDGYRCTDPTNPDGPRCSTVTSNSCHIGGNTFRVGPGDFPSGAVPCGSDGNACNPGTGASVGACTGCYCLNCWPGH